MSGVRIHHPTHKNCIMLVPHPGEFRRGLKIYNKGRKAKDYRIVLDAEGNCIVSETIWQRLQEAKAPFIILNTVENPPPQYLNMREGTYEIPATYRQLQDAIKEIAPPGVKTLIKEA